MEPSLLLFTSSNTDVTQICVFACVSMTVVHVLFISIRLCGNLSVISSTEFDCSFVHQMGTVMLHYLSLKEASARRKSLDVMNDFSF